MLYNIYWNCYFVIYLLWYVRTSPSTTPQDTFSAGPSSPNVWHRLVACNSASPRITIKARSRSWERSRGLNTICKATVHKGVMQSNSSVLMNQFFNDCCVTSQFESLGLLRLSSLASPFPSQNVYTTLHCYGSQPVTIHLKKLLMNFGYRCAVLREIL
jgi:hypothetical protein